ncbi:MAG: hypothetical protein A2503_15755 [Burkholderiales bacterium RIFOXYD12_FULL_59_19]|nr:MAG: hypothetical protein A2503_15755 [Burkholderiales bacterium RIFOXYD12_FULL_59_19]
MGTIFFAVRTQVKDDNVLVPVLVLGVAGDVISISFFIPAAKHKVQQSKGDVDFFASSFFG